MIRCRMTKRRSRNKPNETVTAKRRASGNKPRSKTSSARHAPKKRRLDILKGEFTLPPEFFDPLPEEEMLRWEARSVKQARELERINAAADRLNAEAEEVLKYEITDF